MKDEFPVYDICNLSGFKQEDILISRFAPYLQVHKNLQRPHRHTFYHLVLFTEGAGTHTIDFESFPVTPKQIYFMVPGQVHSWNFDGKVDGYVINFSTSFFQSFLLKSDYLENFPFFSGTPADAVIELPELLQAEIIGLFEKLIKLSEDNRRMSVDLIKTIMLQLFILIATEKLAHHPSNLTSYNYTLLKNFQKLIDLNFTTMKLPKEYAEMLFITPNHLNALCKVALDISAGEVIRNRVVLEAKRHLINLDLSVTEISYRLGFADNSYFTKFFKKQAGITPEDFRNKQLTNK
ncbi:MAG TPA: helix-turn-helix transcriptional regulator [Mucilaginibacter sp.]|jgi:AraC-like DNA-binding protein